MFYAKGGIHRINVETEAVTNIPFQINDKREIRQAVTVKNEVSPKAFEARMLRWLQVSPAGDLAVSAHDPEAARRLGIRAEDMTPSVRMTELRNWLASL